MAIESQPDRWTEGLWKWHPRSRIVNFACYVCDNALLHVWTSDESHTITDSGPAATSITKFFIERGSPVAGLMHWRHPVRNVFNLGHDAIFAADAFFGAPSRGVPLGNQ